METADLADRREHVKTTAGCLTLISNWCTCLGSKAAQRLAVVIAMIDTVTQCMYSKA